MDLNSFVFFFCFCYFLFLPLLRILFFDNFSFFYPWFTWILFSCSILCFIFFSLNILSYRLRLLREWADDGGGGSGGVFDISALFTFKYKTKQKQTKQTEHQNTYMSVCVCIWIADKNHSLRSVGLRERERGREIESQTTSEIMLDLRGHYSEWKGVKERGKAGRTRECHHIVFFLSIANRRESIPSTSSPALRFLHKANFFFFVNLL